MLLRFRPEVWRCFGNKDANKLQQNHLLYQETSSVHKHVFQLQKPAAAAAFFLLREMIC